MNANKTLQKIARSFSASFRKNATLLGVLCMILPSPVQANNFVFSGQLVELKPAGSETELTIKHEEGIAHFNINSRTRIQSAVPAANIKTGDQVLSDGEGTLLPALDFDGGLPQAPEIDHPPAKPDASRPDSAPPQMPAGPPPHEGQAPPPGAAPPEGAAPPASPPDGEEQPEQSSGPQKKKPWEIELENAKEPEDSLQPEGSPISEPSPDDMREARQVVIVKKVSDVEEEEKLIELQLMTPEGKIETCKVAPDKLVYRLMGMQELNKDLRVKLEVTKEENQMQIVSVTVL